MLTELQETVANTAKARLYKEPWFRGVCIDEMPSDEEIKADFEGAVTTVMLDTAYHDADVDFLNGDDNADS